MDNPRGRLPDRAAGRVTAVADIGGDNCRVEAEPAEVKTARLLKGEPAAPRKGNRGQEDRLRRVLAGEPALSSRSFLTTKTSQQVKRNLEEKPKAGYRTTKARWGRLLRRTQF